MDIILHRTIINEKITEGYLSIKNKPVCDTLENTIYCLAHGEYRIELGVCRQYDTITIQVSTQFRDCSKCLKKRIKSQHSDLPCFCPLIKVGNGAYNRTDGSIIVGKKYLYGVVLKSQSVYKRLYFRIRKAIERGKEVRLIVE